MTTGQKKDKMLNAIDFNGRPFTELYRLLIDANDEDGKIDLLMHEMMNDRLIKYEDNNGTPKESGFVILDIKGQKVKDAGGWIKVKYSSMTNEEKLHRLLKYVVETNPKQFDWRATDLLPAFEGALNQHEVKYLCQILIDNGDAIRNASNDGFSIGFIDKSINAFYGNKYNRKQTEGKETVRLDITGPIQNIIGSTINAPITQSRDSLSSSNVSNNVNNEQISKEVMPVKIWTASNITFVILTGIIIGLLVLIFWEKIRLLF